MRRCAARGQRDVPRQTCCKRVGGLFRRNMGLAVTSRGCRSNSDCGLRSVIVAFAVRLQPKVDIQTQDIVGFETLRRWRDDDGEIHPPGDFIGLAIELGLIDPITTLCLPTHSIRLSASTKRVWSGHDHQHQRRRQTGWRSALYAPVHGSEGEQVRRSHHARTSTEDAFAAKGIFQTQVLPVLREDGVRVSIDDFGTGYSSLVRACRHHG